jgi:hypothetical protein
MGNYDDPLRLDNSGIIATFPESEKVAG